MPYHKGHCRYMIIVLQKTVARRDWKYQFASSRNLAIDLKNKYNRTVMTVIYFPLLRNQLKERYGKGTQLPPLQKLLNIGCGAFAEYPFGNRMVRQGFFKPK